MADEPRIDDDLLVSSDPTAACLFVVGANESSSRISSVGADGDSLSASYATIEVVVNGVKRVITMPVMPPEDHTVVPVTTSALFTRPPETQTTDAHRQQSASDSKAHLRSLYQTMNNVSTSNSAIFTNAASQQMSSAISSSNLVNGPRLQTSSIAVRPLNMYTQFQAHEMNTSKDARYLNNNLFFVPPTTQQQQDFRMPPVTVVNHRPPLSSAVGASQSNSYYVYSNPLHTFPRQPWNGNHHQLPNIQPVRTMFPQPAMAPNTSFVQLNSSFNAVPRPEMHSQQGSVPFQFHPLFMQSNSTARALQQPNCVQTGGRLLSTPVGSTNYNTGSQVPGVSYTRDFSNNALPGLMANNNVATARALEEFAKSYKHLYSAVNANTVTNAQLGKFNFPPATYSLAATGNLYPATQKSLQSPSINYTNQGLSSLNAYQSQPINRAVRSPKGRRFHDLSHFCTNIPQSTVPVISNLDPQHPAKPPNQLHNSAASNCREAVQDCYSQFRIASTRNLTRPSNDAADSAVQHTRTLSSVASIETKSVCSVNNVTAFRPSDNNFLAALLSKTDTTRRHSTTQGSPGNSGSVNQSHEVASSIAVSSSVQVLPDQPLVANCEVSNASSPRNGGNTNELIDRLLPDVMNSAESDYLLTAFADMLDQPSPETDSGISHATESTNQPNEDPVRTEGAEQSHDLPIVHSSEEIRNALQIAKSIGKGMHHVEEENNRGHLLQTQHARQQRRKQQLTNLESTFADMLDQPSPATDSAIRPATKSANQPNGEPVRTEGAEQSHDLPIVHSSEKIRNALQIAKSIGKGMHHVEEENNRGRLLQRRRARRQPRKQQLTNLEYDETCTNSSDSWHPDEFDSQSTDKTSSSIEISDICSSESWASNDSVTIGRKRQFHSKEHSSAKRKTSRKRGSRRTSSRCNERKTVQNYRKPDLDRISFKIFDIKPCSVKLEVIKMFGRQALTVTEAEQSLCCFRKKVFRKVKRIIESDDETDIDSISSSSISRAHRPRTKVPRISDSDSS